MLCDDDAAANANARAMLSYAGAVLIRQMDNYPCYLGSVDAALMLCSCLAMQC